MLSIKKIITLTSTLIFTMILTSCVGTVADKNSQLSKINASNSNGSFSFEGIKTATGVSHDKIELIFEPATGEPSDLVYEIYVNNSNIPIKIGGASLAINASGDYYFTVTGLALQTTYNFNMRVVASGAPSEVVKLDPLESRSATTFSNETADFAGITSLSLGAGTSGKDKLIVKWVPAVTLGTVSRPRPRDPTAYEITYIKSTAGAAIGGGIRNINNSNLAAADGRFVIQVPATIGSPPAPRSEATLSVDPNTFYYVQVRAIHKGYDNYSGIDPLYKREENKRFLGKKTNIAGQTLSFLATNEFINIKNPEGKESLSRLDLDWFPASGDFDHYRVCYTRIAEPGFQPPIGVDYLQDAIVPPNTEKDIDIIMNNATPVTNYSKCITVNAATTNIRIPDNNPVDPPNSTVDFVTHAYYQAKIIACVDVACTERKISNVLTRKVISNVTPFNGILSVLNPLTADSSQALSTVTLNFDAPIVSSGFMNRFSLYCYDPADLTQRVELDIKLAGNTSSSTIARCNGIKNIQQIKMDEPLSYYENITSLQLELPIIDGSARYCFSLHPWIKHPIIDQNEINKAVVKCFTPEIKTPTVAQFPGSDKNNTCKNPTRDITVTWPEPSGGLYTDFLIAFREKKVGDSFNFNDAIAQFTSGAPGAYKFKTIPKGSPLTLTTQILSTDGLVQGRTYAIGVLTYLTHLGVKKYSQYNINTDDCSLPLPKATFDEWVDIFAVGPKEDGLVPAVISDLAGVKSEVRSYILETLDDDGIPVEIALNANGTSPLSGNSLANQRLGSQKFNGVYGSKNANTSNPLHQYSNSGIVKLAWKDVTFYSQTQSLKDYSRSIALEPTPNLKTSRLFGYRVYRSEDNQLSWTDLTKSAINVGNDGLIHPPTAPTYQWRKRNNVSAETLAKNTEIIFFTDYSVKFSGIDSTNAEIDRARTYWYKIIPVFDGKELLYETAGNNNPSHHVIRVTLPPRNMALVHRNIANRTICLEMNKNINKSAGAHYSCSYNGLGASSLSSQWSTSNSVYDLGGDLLVDRFELSCPFTRGDPKRVDSESLFSATFNDNSKLNFDGFSTSTGNKPYVGCFDNIIGSSAHNESGSDQETNIDSAPFSYKQLMPGDCMGSDRPIAAVSSASGTCTLFSHGLGYIYPGSTGVNLMPLCADLDTRGPNFSNGSDPDSYINNDADFMPIQSGLASVYFKRTGWSHGFPGAASINWHMGARPLAANDIAGPKRAISNGGVPNSCQVNLPYIKADGTYRPRWLPINSLFGRLTLSGSTVSMGINNDGLYNDKISEIRSNDDLYNSNVSPVHAEVEAPPAASATLSHDPTLARVVSSNSAKLPPLDGLSQKDLYKLCGTYKVDVGVETATKSFVKLTDTKSKRLLRRKESIVAAAWPAQYDSAKVLSIESGTFSEAPTGNTACNAPAKAIFGIPNLVKGSFLGGRYPQASKGSAFLASGSSSLDPLTPSMISTEKCVSRFGIQDIVGNTKETNAEELFCDTSANADQLYLGKKVSGSIDYTEAVPYNNLNGFQSNYFRQTTSFGVENLSMPSSGACSVNEVGVSPSTAYSNGSVINSIYQFLGLDTLDNQIIKQARSFDQDAVLASRNGDGSFLRFEQGSNGMAVALSADNAIALNDPDSTYFNPVLGLTLACNDGCNDGSTFNDNAKFSTTSILAAKLAANAGYTPPTQLVINDFPVNNSQLNNVGLSSFSVASQYDTTSNGGVDVPDVSYIYAVNPGATPSLADNSPITNTAGPIVNNIGALHSAAYTVERHPVLNTVLRMYTGGSSSEAPGRYSLLINGSVQEEVERYVYLNNGGRCAVMINND